jgi:ABC-type nickel/cobalt efflux system permease component RcnA
VPSRRRRHAAWSVVALAIACTGIPAAWSHDIPNERIDRSIQVSVLPGRLQVDYEVGLTELTLTQDLRRLIGGLPGADRAEWLARYGQVTGPLNAKGILVAVDGRPLALGIRGCDLAVEEHPRYTFHFEVPIPSEGRLSVHDTNYVSSEGTSRLAVRGRGGAVVTGDRLPPDVEQIEIRPVWLLSDAEERRTKQVEVHFRTGRAPASAVMREPNKMTDDQPVAPDAGPAPALEKRAGQKEAGRGAARGSTRISALLDETASLPWLILGVMALGLGAVHAIQPGHGKTLVAAVAIGPGARFYQPALLGLATTLAHTASVLLLAAALWYTGATRVGMAHQALTKVAGFAIAAAGAWRVGRYLGGFKEHDRETLYQGAISNRALIGLGLAGGMVPCWDAVGLLVLAAALGRLATGIGLVLAFSAGMALVLIAVGSVAWKVKSRALARDREPKWQRGLGMACGMMLTAIGLFLFFQYDYQ